MSVLGRNQNIN